MINAENINSVEMLGLPFTHRANIYSRLAFVKQILSLSQSPLSLEQLDQIWDILVTQSSINIDQHLFFEWFRGILEDNINGCRPSEEAIKNFFESRVCKRTEEGAFKDIKVAGFECIQSMFLTINQQEDKIRIISFPSVVAGNVQQKLDFNVLVPPSQLRGIEIMWRIMQDCDKKNMDLTAPIIDLITKLYHHLSEEIPQEDVVKIQDEFCKELLHQMR